MAILTRDGDLVIAGDAQTPASIQSISKVFTLELALEAYGNDLWKRAGREPSGNPCNSIIDLSGTGAPSSRADPVPGAIRRGEPLRARRTAAAR